MFTKKPGSEPPPLGTSHAAAPAPAQTPPLPKSAGTPSRPGGGLRTGEKMSPSVIGTDLTIVGNLISKGEVQIDGSVQGDLHGTHIVVGEKAQITGGIVADDVIVRGTVEGSIRGLRVTLQSSSHVEGDIYHQSLAIEQGAFFEGKSRRAEDPMAGVKSPDSANATAPRGPSPSAIAPATPASAAAPASASAPSNGTTVPPRTN